MSQIHVVITGANRGIGFALAQQFQQRGERVTAVCRQPSDALQQLGCSIISGIDVTRSDDIATLKQQLKGTTIDVLINNAGLLHREQLGELDSDAMVAQFKVNAVGPLMITEALREYLPRGSKVALITSRMGSMADNGSGAYYGYRMSKAALNAAGVSLANDLVDAGVAVAMLHPGFVQTEMVNNAGDISAEEAAQRLIKRIDELTMASSGQFKHSNGDSLPW